MATVKRGAITTANAAARDLSETNALPENAGFSGSERQCPTPAASDFGISLERISLGQQITSKRPILRHSTNRGAFVLPGTSLYLRLDNLDHFCHHAPPGCPVCPVISEFNSDPPGTLVSESVLAAVTAAWVCPGICAC